MYKFPAVFCSIASAARPLFVPIPFLIFFFLYCATLLSSMSDSVFWLFLWIMTFSFYFFFPVFDHVHDHLSGSPESAVQPRRVRALKTQLPTQRVRGTTLTVKSSASVYHHTETNNISRHHTGTKQGAEPATSISKQLEDTTESCELSRRNNVFVTMLVWCQSNPTSSPFLVLLSQRWSALPPTCQCFFFFFFKSVCAMLQDGSQCSMSSLEDAWPTMVLTAREARVPPRLSKISMVDMYEVCCFCRNRSRANLRAPPCRTQTLKTLTPGLTGVKLDPDSV